MPAIVTNDPTRLFVAHGVVINNPDAAGELQGECPFCGKEKFYLDPSTTKWSCFPCNMSGNNYEFLRRVHALSLDATTAADYEWLSNHRELSPDTLRAWGVVKSVTTGEWLVPGYTLKGEVGQLYRYTPNSKGKYVLKASPGFPSGDGQQLFGVPLFESDKQQVAVAESWSAMALWEVLQHPSLHNTNTVTNVIGVPGATVFRDQWARLVGGKAVTLYLDNDHPVPVKGGTFTDGAGLSGSRHAVQVMSGDTENKPESISWLQWGAGGYSPDLPSGYDLRDHMVKGVAHDDRPGKFREIASNVVPVPEEWVVVEGKKREAKIWPVPCKSWVEVRDALRQTIKCNWEIENSLAVLFASVISTMTIDDQIWVKFQAPPSSGKTTIVKGLEVASLFVTGEDKFRGFTSGYKTDKDGTKDYSLAARIHSMTVVFKDADTIMSLPNLEEIMSEFRVVYDGGLKNSFKTEVNRNYQNLRTTVILCGTGSTMKMDASEFGERFLTYEIMSEVGDDMEDEMSRMASSRMVRNMSIKANCKPESYHDANRLRYMQLCGGYVEHLRRNSDELLGQVEFPELMRRRCETLAKLVVRMRARPSKTQGEVVEVELPMRVTGVLTKMAQCVAAVTQQPEVNRDVMRVVKKVAMDTAKGRTLEIVKALYNRGVEGAEARTVAQLTNQATAEEQKLLTFLSKIRVVESFSFDGKTVRYRLTERMRSIWVEVMKY